MQPSEHLATTADTATDDETDHLPAPNQQHPELAQYIKTHRLPASAANDPHQLALEEFLFEHMQRRANAETE